MIRQLIFVGALAAMFAAGPSLGASEPPPEPPAQSTLTTAPTTAAAVDAQYRIGPDDTLEIVVFQVPELSRTMQVDSAGQLSMPLLGRIDAAGRTADELAALLTEKLQGRYLKDPLITVIVKQAVSQRVTVQGAVVKPGVYSLAGPTTLLQAVALANGPDLRIANLKRVAVFRNVGGARRGEVYNLAKIQSGKAIDPPVRADDVIVVDASGTRSFFTYFGSSLPVLSLFRFF